MGRKPRLVSVPPGQKPLIRLDVQVIAGLRLFISVYVNNPKNIRVFLKSHFRSPYNFHDHLKIFLGFRGTNRNISYTKARILRTIKKSEFVDKN